MSTNSNGKIRKVVIAAAGMGTRFLPATKSQPKEMLPLIDKPIIQYLVEEAVESGIEDVILVTRMGQSTLENHFDSNFELECYLKSNGKKDLLEKVQRLEKMANFIYVRQHKHLPYGNATPLIAVRDLIGKNERFVYMFGDDLVLSKTPCAKQIMDYSDQRDNSVTVAVQEIQKEEVNRYGIYKLVPGSKDRVKTAIEKPNPEDIDPPYLAQFGRFVLNKDVVNTAYDFYKQNKLGKNNELWLIDSIIEYAKKNPVYAAKIEGEWMTTGDPLRYMKTQVRYALIREDIGQEFAKFLKNLKL